MEPITEFIRKGTGKLTRSQYRAKTSAIMALGYLINKSGSQKVLEYLTTVLDPQTWPEMKVSSGPPRTAPPRSETGT